MFNILEEVNAFLLTKTTPYASIGFEVFPNTTVKAIIARHESGTWKDQTYMDKSRTGTLNFSYYARSGSQLEARAQIETILQILDIPEFIQLSEVCQVKIEPVTPSVFVGTTDDQQYIFSGSLGLEYLKEA